MMIKYPIHKVAKDFKRGSKEIPSKEIMDILTQYGHPPKNHMQPLTDEELSVLLMTLAIICALFAIFLLILAKRRKDDEEDERL